MANAGGQAREAEDVGGAAFEEIRHLTRLRFTGAVAAGSALAPGPQFGSVSDVERPRPGGTQQRLVARKGEQVDVHGQDVDGNDPGRLGRIDQEQEVVFAGDPADFRDRLNRAKDVAGMRESDQARARVNGLADVVGLNGAAAVGGHACQGDTAIEFHGPQGPANAVVFQVGRDDMVAVVQNALEGHVEGVGAV